LQAAAAVRKAGVVVLRNVVPREQAVQWKQDLEAYLGRNRDGVLGYPAAKPVV
jgi:hypothetical protein